MTMLNITYFPDPSRPVRCEVAINRRVSGFPSMTGVAFTFDAAKKRYVATIGDGEELIGTWNLLFVPTDGDEARITVELYQQQPVSGQLFNRVRVGPKNSSRYYLGIDFE